MSGIFITGTGTDVGKTIITAGILRYLVRKGRNVAPFKPVQTGAEMTDGARRAPDLEYCLKVAGLKPCSEDRARMAPYLYDPACSPHLAAEMAGDRIELARILESAEELNLRYEAVLSEGAGGVLVPLNEDETNLDLMVRLGWPVILVAHRGLGTINHTLLSLRALRDAGVTVLGLVLNATEEAPLDFMQRDNRDTLARMGPVEILGSVDYLPGVGPGADEAWERFETCMPGLGLIETTLLAP